MPRHRDIANAVDVLAGESQREVFVGKLGRLVVIVPTPGPALGCGCANSGSEIVIVVRAAHRLCPLRCIRTSLKSVLKSGGTKTSAFRPASSQRALSARAARSLAPRSPGPPRIVVGGDQEPLDAGDDGKPAHDAVGAGRPDRHAAHLEDRQRRLEPCPRPRAV